MGKHNEFGKEGEQIATDFLLKKGYTISYRNYRYLKAEIDIIAQKIKKSDKPVIVFTKYGPFTDNSIKNLYYAGVAAYPSVGRAVRAARFLVERTKIKKRLGTGDNK